jgi:hypothetical protein
MFKSFGLYIESPFFKVNQNIRSLHQLIILNRSKLATLKDEKVFKSIYPNQKFKLSKLRYLYSDYNKVIEEFLAINTLSEKEELRELLTYEGLINHGPEKIVISKEKALKKKLYDSTIQRGKYRKELEELSYSFHAEHQSLQINNNLQDLSNAIDQDFIYHKLKFSCELLTRKEVLSKDYDFSFLEAIVQYANQRLKPDQPVLYAYFKLIDLIQDPKDESYFYIKDYLREEQEAIPKTDLMDMHVFIINYAIKQSNLGRLEFQRQLFEIYDHLLRNEIITINDQLSIHNFKNISTTALLLKEYAWLDQFSEQFKERVDYVYRKSSFAFNKARVSFQRGDFSSAIKHLSQMEHTDLYYDLGERILWIKIYFELSEYDLFYANINSFQIYLNRNKVISEYQKSLYKAFIKWLKRLYAYREGKTRYLKQWLEELKNSNVADKTWILGKFKDDESD